MAKWQLPKFTSHRKNVNNCNYLKDLDSLFTENINDVADALIEIMIIFGIEYIKAKTAKSVIIKAFKFYDNKRHRLYVVNENGLNRCGVVCNFQGKCKMSYMEALLAYTVLKRAVKAYFHGFTNFSLRRQVAEVVAIEKQEFFWQHAAARTNQLFAAFEHVFSQAPHNYEEQVIQVYKKLYERLKSRMDAVLIEGYTSRKGIKSVRKLNSKTLKCVEKSERIDVEMFMRNLPRKEISLTTNRQFWSEKLSKSLQHKSERKTHREIELKTDCSQGPFNCQWITVDNFVDTGFGTQQNTPHICPIDCATSESSIGSDSYKCCDCSEEDVCKEANKSAEKYSSFQNYA